MAEYIEREDAIAVLWYNQDECGSAIVSDIEAIPAADVAPVVRGRWVDGKCDNCGEHAPYWCLSTTFHESNYCPNCGADMRGEKDG